MGGAELATAKRNPDGKVVCWYAGSHQLRSTSAFFSTRNWAPNESCSRGGLDRSFHDDAYRVQVPRVLLVFRNQNDAVSVWSLNHFTKLYSDL